MTGNEKSFLEELVQEIQGYIEEITEELEEERIPKAGDLVVAKPNNPYNITTCGKMALGIFLGEHDEGYRDVSKDGQGERYEAGDEPLKVLLVEGEDEYQHVNSVFPVNPKYFKVIGYEEFQKITEELFEGKFETTGVGEFRDVLEGQLVDVSADYEIAGDVDSRFLQADTLDDFDWFSQDKLKKHEELEEELVGPGDLVVAKPDAPYGITCEGTMALGLILDETHPEYKDVAESFLYSSGDRPLKIILLEDGAEEWEKTTAIQHVFTVNPIYFEKVDRDIFEEITHDFTSKKYETVVEGEFQDIKEGEVVEVSARYTVAKTGDPYFLRGINSEGETDFFRPQDLVETEELVEKHGFKEGDLVKAKPYAPYNFTNEDMLLGEVVGFGDYSIHVEILEHVEDEHVGDVFPVTPDYFYKVETKFEEGDIVFYRDSTWFGNEGLGEVIGQSPSGNPLIKSIDDEGTTKKYYLEADKLVLVAKKESRLDK